MLITNTGNQFGLIAKLLHWIMAVLMIGLVALGLYMVRIPISAEKLKFFGWHKEWGMVVLVLVIIRFIWRVTTITPSLFELSYWERIAARAAHWAFYFFMLALPITGWLVTSASGLPVSVFGWFIMPDLISPNETYRVVYSEVHEWLSYAFLFLLTMHICAALKHHFINKDNIMRRML